MNLEIRYANHPSDSKYYTTEELRNHYLIEKLFVENEAALVYSHIDRIIAGGVMPVGEKIKLSAGKELGVSYFFERREAGIINIGGKGKITIDGNEFILDNADGLYIGMGSKDVIFESDNINSPAKFYFNSSPAHKAYPTRIITLGQSRKVKLGEKENLNVRTINQYIHPNICESCQLVMGMTIFEPGNVWNTMPPHTHERRMEVYMYFNMNNEARVFHLMGQPQEIRHIVVANEQAVISPSWSIHSGVGTSNYTFIWGMCGENIEFTDMDHIAIKELK
ncbi:5-dehydro-4-deoxy-D-glucuronate isomerase [Serpentinicella alkaliphila]|uniref:4-deoxy-L-threo-5-hexosulose-uronate ketol-isomerase n=1 Tax=Serpentinicella alkaliphila TaxID=1734049 RepID=A0A4R2UCR0_9FIRM|nr:5-dehydro-4-deoxy-D-glucuronate isomerase [Serpentinicella alkaliphila]QUH26833.1 5-dehydro-4-deoxy-D-glucuronate isomerase [Serpentinicella alkaliphila]TCQ08059.1 4-deoxy-L-threo-5-hexulose uronate isomerase [Serpentinicella alkaliphila]